HGRRWTAEARVPLPVLHGEGAELVAELHLELRGDVGGEDDGGAETVAHRTPFALAVNRLHEGKGLDAGHDAHTLAAVHGERLRHVWDAARIAELIQEEEQRRGIARGTVPEPVE